MECFSFQKKREDDGKIDKMMKNREAAERKVVFVFCFYKTDHVQTEDLKKK